jgi:hypothetical protein
MKIRTVHPFPARMAPEIALRKLEGLPRNSLVLDPMVGSGTVVRQALALGHRAIGFDMDPLAVLMSRVWTSPIDAASVEHELDLLVTEAAEVDLRTTTLPWHDAETTEFVHYWFAPTQRRSLTRLAAVLARRRAARLGEVRRAAVDVLHVALSRIIVTKEQCASLARDTSHSRPHRVADNNTYDVVMGLRRSVASLLDRLQEHPLRGRAEVALGDARAMTLRRDTVDYILTSPPYLCAATGCRWCGLVTHCCSCGPSAPPPSAPSAPAARPERMTSRPSPAPCVGSTTCQRATKAWYCAMRRTYTSC